MLAKKVQKQDNPPIKPVIEHYQGKVPRDVPGWQKIRCPFHGDAHASAAVNIGDGIFVCHGCGVKGNAFSIIMNKEGVSFREAVSIAEGITGQSSGALRSISTGGRGLSGSSRLNSRRGRIRLARGSE